MPVNAYAHKMNFYNKIKSVSMKQTNINMHGHTH